MSKSRKPKTDKETPVERKYAIRKALLGDVRAVQTLINRYSARNMMLPRALGQLYENIRDLYVCEDEGRVVGCIAMHVCWEDLAEVKCLAVDEAHNGRGIGRRLLDAALQEASDMKVKKVFVLTYAPGFFKKAGFREIDKSNLPHKIWRECIDCVKFPDCDETALTIDMSEGETDCE